MYQSDQNSKPVRNEQRKRLKKRLILHVYIIIVSDATFKVCLTILRDKHKRHIVQD